MTEKKAKRSALVQLNHYVQRLCGLYSRVARKLGVDRSYVSRVARGERRSTEVEEALTAEFKDFKQGGE
jgi:transcriptional regulator with XRE-family HTH domain